MALARRVRGALLRLVRRRTRAALVGAALAIPAAWVQFSDGDFPWWIRGAALCVGAVGIALLWTGVAGLGPDWVDEG